MTLLDNMIHSQLQTNEDSDNDEETSPVTTTTTTKKKKKTTTSASAKKKEGGLLSYSPGAQNKKQLLGEIIPYTVTLRTIRNYVNDHDSEIRVSDGAVKEARKFAVQFVSKRINKGAVAMNHRGKKTLTQGDINMYEEAKELSKPDVDLYQPLVSDDELKRRREKERTKGMNSVEIEEFRKKKKEHAERSRENLKRVRERKTRGETEKDASSEKNKRQQQQQQQKKKEEAKTTGKKRQRPSESSETGARKRAKK